VTGAAGLLQAVLWDMDGLLVDTEPLWTRAEHDLAAHYGGTFTPAAKAAIVGTRLDAAVPLLLGHFGVEATPEEVRTAGRLLLSRVVALFLAEPLPLQPGAGRLLADLAAAGVPCALVSSSFRVLVDAVLSTGAGPFAVTIAGDEVTLAKPHPEPYLTAAARLRADPARCVVLEDSPTGVASGTAAGCAVVAVPSVAGVAIGPAPRRTVVRSLEELSVEGLAHLVRQSAA
jgi:HAD superfamily hydrolase (TIGR01509 family)